MLGQWSSVGNTLIRNMNLHYAASMKSMERLSSGYRINRAADDPAGLAISEKMRAQIRGLNQASRNIQDGISLLNTADGALHESHMILQRMRELSVQTATDTLTDADRQMAQFEFEQLQEELTRISTHTEFNTMPLLDGSRTQLKIQTGANAGQSMSLTLNDMSAHALHVDTIDLTTRENAEEALSKIDHAINQVATERGRIGAYTNRLEHADNNVQNMSENLTAAESRIRDVDIAKEMMAFTKANILLQASQAIFALHQQQAYSVLQLLKNS